MNRELPKYNCTKQVRALKIKEILKSDVEGAGAIIPEDENYSPIEVSNKYMKKHSPRVGGYYVKYEDGYESFSPVKAFEEGYTLIEEKEIELVRGKIYVSDVKTNDNNQSVNLVFRYLKESQKDHPYKRIATDSEKIRYVEWEEKNGKFWNDEKQDFLKLEDVRCPWSCMQDLSEILPFVDKFSSEEDSFDDTWVNFLSFKEDGLISSQFGRGLIEVTKEVFIKLLKNYKGVSNI